MWYNSSHPIAPPADLVLQPHSNNDVDRIAANRNAALVL